MRIEKDNWLRNTRICHRGLWGKDVPENSMLAYQKAVDNGFAIEIDVYLTSDNEIVIHHDPTTLRMCGVDKKISSCTLKELKELRLDGTSETIPTLKELLKITEGKSPLLIEIKSVSKNAGKLEEILYNILKDYKGEFAIQSFNPFSVKWFTENAPHIIRGQLASYFKGENTLPWYQKFMLKRLMFNGITKPDFISYDEKALPNIYVKRTKKQGKLLIAWTVTSMERQIELEKFCDNVIFENYQSTPKI